MKLRKESKIFVWNFLLYHKHILLFSNIKKKEFFLWEIKENERLISDEIEI